MKTAVVYYSMSGNTQQTAERIASELNADLIRLDPVKEYPSTGFKKFFWGGKSAMMGEKPRLQPYRFDGDYDRIIIGTPVWASNMAPPIRSFIRENREALAGKNIAAFVCFSGGGADKALEKLKQYLGVESFSAKLILIDPKATPKPEDDAAIASFCDQLR
jgi:flavodoxin